MKIKMYIVIVVIIVIMILSAIVFQNNEIKKCENQISYLNNEIINLEKNEKKYTNLKVKKEELTEKTRNEILNAKKGTELKDLISEKNILFNEIKDEINYSNESIN
ncbi:MAG TPA: hypothetical protein PK993_00525 [Clostridia bacterium]|jgi:hypothetical protein|nr:hypothetical protein [Clostridia bacterium]